MSTRSVVARRTEDGGFKGRYVHLDGYPSGVGATVEALIRRDGAQRVVQVITEENYGWSSLDETEWGPLHEMYRDGRFQVVQGYGVAYTTHQGQSSPDDWHTHESVEGNVFIEWVYVIEEDGSVTTYEHSPVDGPLRPWKGDL